MIKNIVIPLSSYFESKSTYYLPLQVSSQNSFGKSHYFNLEFRISLSTITELKNDRDRILRVGPSCHKEEVTQRIKLYVANLVLPAKTVKTCLMSPRIGPNRSVAYEEMRCFVQSLMSLSLYDNSAQLSKFCPGHFSIR